MQKCKKKGQRVRSSTVHCMNLSARAQVLSPRSRTRSNSEVLLCYRNGDRSMDEFSQEVPKLVPMEMQHNGSALNHSKFTRNPHNRKMSAAEQYQRPQTPIEARESLHSESTVPRLNLDYRSPGGANNSPLRACRARCPDGPRLVYTEETSRSFGAISSARSHYSNAVGQAKPTPCHLIHTT